MTYTQDLRELPKAVSVSSAGQYRLDIILRYTIQATSNLISHLTYPLALSCLSRTNPLTSQHPYHLPLPSSSPPSLQPPPPANMLHPLLPRSFPPPRSPNGSNPGDTPPCICTAHTAAGISSLVHPHAVLYAVYDHGRAARVAGARSGGLRRLPRAAVSVEAGCKRGRAAWCLGSRHRGGVTRRAEWWWRRVAGCRRSGRCRLAFPLVRRR